MVLLMAACSGEDVSTDGQDVAITLGAAVEKTVTRAGGTGSIDYSTLSHASYGFGVFTKIAASTDGWTDWTNKQVTYSGPEPEANAELTVEYPGSWTYDSGTMKYWVRDANKQALSFYAYAPYVAAGSGTAGITAVGSSTSDPTVTYTVAAEPQNAVDLLWGVNSSTGLPWTNVTQDGTTGGLVLMTFRHALAAIGIHAQVMIDKANDTSDLEDKSDEDDNYVVTIDKIELVGNFHPSGTLHLNNTSANSPLWDKTAATETTLTVPNGQISEAMRHAGGTGITQAVQQPVIARRTSPDAEQLFFVIPNTAQNYTLKLYWHVRDGETTVVDKTSTPTAIAINSLELAAGTKYYLNLVIGLNTVKVNVTATDWTDTPVETTVLTEPGTTANQSLSRQQ